MTYKVDPDTNAVTDESGRYLFTAATEKEIATMSDPLLQFFTYAHLPEPLQEVSAMFGELAKELVEILPRNPERTVMLRKLLEAKDCAVRARLYQE
jgi:hypothetical protein